MAESNNATLHGIDLSKIVNPPLHEHGAFDEIGADQSRIFNAALALTGIGKMMRPEINYGHQMSTVRIGEVGPVFEFFGDVLLEYAEGVIHAAERLRKELRERGQS